MTRRILLALALAVLLSGCVAAAPAEHPDDDHRLGWENGYAHDDPVAVTTADGLNATEREAVVARAMARLEHLRGLEFTEPVSVRLESREQFRANRSTDENGTHVAWNNQVWKALFLVGADRDVNDVFDDALGSRVIGYYEPGTGEIVIVSDSETPQISRGTLVHELVHALQDQRFGLEAWPDTQDRQLARNGVVEGEANRLQSLYVDRCGGAWDCVPETGSGGGGGSLGPYGENVFTVIYHPYATGPAFVERIAATGDAAALNALYDPYPASTEQLIHPGAYPDEVPVDVTVPDRARGNWTRFDVDPAADTVGEASIFAMVVANDLGETDVGRFSYRHPVSAGWGGDAVVPYRDGDRFGYVWTTAWDTERDAREFRAAYEELLTRRNAVRLGETRYRLPDGDPFGGGYRITRDGRRVTVVHGPTPAALDRIHAP